MFTDITRRHSSQINMQLIKIAVFSSFDKLFPKFAWKNIQVKITKRIWQENNNTQTLALQYIKDQQNRNPEIDWKTGKKNI